MDKIIAAFCGMLISTTVLAVETKNITYSYSTSKLANQLRKKIDSDNQIKQIKILIPEPKTASFDILPIVTPNMKSGVFEQQKINLVNLDKPIFIVGSDNLSISWLTKYAAKLKKLNAIGLLVQADTNLEVARVKKAANGAIILPMSGEIIGEQLGIHNYPVLITKNLVEQ